MTSLNLEAEVKASSVAVVFADGGSRGNPGPSGCGAVVKSDSIDGEVLASLSKFVGIATNNVAEYTGLLIGLEKALAMGFSEVEVRMDSELIVKQIKGQYRCKNEGLIPLFNEAKRLQRQFKKFNIEHVRREYNKEADLLANQAMDKGE
jgi:ribonuclease HI